MCEKFLLLKKRESIPFLLVGLFCTTLWAGKSYQAENATAIASCQTLKAHSGHTGTGYLDFGGQGSYCEWDNVSVSQAGNYTLSFRYANYSGGNRPCQVIVNNTVQGTLDFPVFGLDWYNWGKMSLTVPLNAGNNTIRLRAHTAAGGPNIDRMDVDGGDAIEYLSDYASHKISGKSVVVTTTGGQRIRYTSYGPHMVRVQAVRKNEDFFADHRNEMVEHHNHGSTIALAEFDDYLEISPDNSSSLQITVTKKPLISSFMNGGGSQTYLKEILPLSWDGSDITVQLESDPTEHFAGLGHTFYGRETSLDRKGTRAFRNYGRGERDDQSPMVVPFYLSSKRYGVFLNSTFKNHFALSINGEYSFGIDDEDLGGRIDYFVIAADSLPQILTQYVNLTGLPRFPQKSMFGLRLSDKNSPDNSGEQWWKNQVKKHRDAGYPLDVVINDNRWRSGTGAWSGSWFEFDPTRYPDPARYQTWLDSMGLTVSLDHNRNNNELCEGWQSSFNLPNTTGNIQSPQSAPDYSSQTVRNWQWKLFWDKAFNPALKYPGDAIWIDETDELRTIPSKTVVASGQTWGEIENYYSFLIAKAVGQQGWDQGIGEAKRPYIWMRSGTAGMQRYATMWSGDLENTYDEMKGQIRAMQAAGLSGFPYFDHDAGGHKNKMTDDLYMQWGMGMGALSPIWRPHGFGQSRWPHAKSEECQSVAMKYSILRYTLIPYLYTIAAEAARTGYPMAAPMLLHYPDEAQAWKADLQYFLGKNLLVAPNPSAGDNFVTLWLPGEKRWYDFWTDSLYAGGRHINYHAAQGVVPLFVPEGAIIPQAPYRLSTFFIPKDTLMIDVYTGKDGSFTLYDDDGISEKYRKNEYSLTPIQFAQHDYHLRIGKTTGTFSNSPKQRVYRIIFHGVENDLQMYQDTTPFVKHLSKEALEKARVGQYWDSVKKQLTLYTSGVLVSDLFSVRATSTSSSLFSSTTATASVGSFNAKEMTLSLSSVKTGEKVDVQIINMKGVVVFKKDYFNQNTILLPTSFAPGAYVLNLSSPSLRWTEKFVFAP